MDAPQSCPPLEFANLRRQAQGRAHSHLWRRPATSLMPEPHAYVIHGQGPAGVEVFEGPQVGQPELLPEAVLRYRARAVLLAEPVRLSWLRMTATVILPCGSYGWQATVGVGGGYWRVEKDWEPIPNGHGYRPEIQQALREVAAADAAA